MCVCNMNIFYNFTTNSKHRNEVSTKVTKVIGHTYDKKKMRKDDTNEFFVAAASFDL